ncbi:PhoH family protein [Sporosarcina sp. ACRSL]|uniref:PhoH family protein n=1 Tax=Sporosarcina sp. ACRSL TaxID=2918215 RepID=UPI001EF66938|nr:PhoH family protein [Sporosarcina sp. ACRSL]MCG7345341.1 PhoH family protein [Sporosarcina sp. ACRSL]
MPLPSDNLLFGYAPKLTEEQRIYVDSIFDNKVTIVNAKAGTGKTTLAVAVARLLGKPMYYTFAPVEEDALGFTPGDVEEKESKYIVPLIDALTEIREDPRLAIHRDSNPDFMNAGAWVTAKSHVFMRGTNLKNCTLIIDESQNMTRGDLKKVLTRCHDSVTVIMIGHVGQNDIADPSKSGFADYLEHYRDQPYAQVCDLTVNFRGVISQHADKLSW